MKIIKITVLLLCLSLVVKTSSDAGIKLGLNEDSIESLKGKLLEIVNKKIANINMNDYKLQPISLLFWEAEVEFDNINFRLLPITTDQVIIKFNSPNVIQLEIDEIRGSGGILGAVNVCSFGSQIGGYIKINNIQIIATLTIDQVQSAVEGKYLPSVQIETLSVDVNVSVNLTGNWVIDYLNKFLSFVNGYFNVYNYVVGMEIKKLQSYFNTQINEILGNMNPIYQIEGIIPIDLSLASNPVINNDVLIIEMVGVAGNSTSNAIQLPQIDTNITSTQIFISQSIIQSILNSLYLNNKILFNSQSVPEAAKFFSMSNLEDLCSGLRDQKIPYDTPNYIIVSSTPSRNKLPVVQIQNGAIQLTFFFTFEIYIQQANKEFKKEVQFDFELDLVTNVLIESGVIRLNHLKIDPTNAVVDQKYLNTPVNLFMISIELDGIFSALSSHIQSHNFAGIEKFIIDSTEINYPNNYIDISLNPS